MKKIINFLYQKYSDAKDFSEWIPRNATVTGFGNTWVYFGGKEKYNSTKTTQELYKIFRNENNR